MKFSEKRLKIIVWGVTILIPIVVTVLSYLPGLELSSETTARLYVLPKINAFLNGTAFLTLIAAWIAIKNKRIMLHKALTSSALILSVLFLISYITFHFTTASTHYCGDGNLKYFYFFILISHIILSAAIVPLVLFTYVRGWAMDTERHKRLAHVTWPLWLYVTGTGVLVYLLISPCYPV